MQQGTFSCPTACPLNPRPSGQAEGEGEGFIIPGNQPTSWPCLNYPKSRPSVVA